MIDIGDLTNQQLVDEASCFSTSSLVAFDKAQELRGLILEKAIPLIYEYDAKRKAEIICRRKEILSQLTQGV